MDKFRIVFLSAFFWLSSPIIYAQSTTLMSYNIRYDNKNDKENWWGNRKDDVVALIHHYRPDFIGIQEGLSHQVNYIKDNSKDYDYIGVGRDDGDKKGEYTALFYNLNNFELVKSTTFWLSETPDKISVGWDASMERICTYGEFRSLDSGAKIHVFNAHFDHIGPKARLESAKLILSKISEFGLSEKNVIVMGDLNSEPTSEPILAFNEVLDDGLTSSKHKFYGPIGTFNAFKPEKIMDKRIDYIFSVNVKIKEYIHIDDRRPNNLWVSDHIPVLIKVKL